MARKPIDDDEDDDAPRKPKPKVKKPAPPPPPPPVSAGREGDDESPYAVIKESEEEEKVARQHRTGFGRVQDKFKRSARGPASAILVTPSNLLLAQGALTAVVGIALIVLGWWPIIFTDVPTADDEFADQMGIFFLGLILCSWAGITCYGAFHMSKLDSYPWAFVGAIFGLLPLLAGIFAIIALKDPRVMAGFVESEGGPNADVEEGKKKDEEDEDEDDEEEERPRKKKKKR